VDSLEAGGGSTTKTVGGRSAGAPDAQKMRLRNTQLQEEINDLKVNIHLNMTRAFWMICYDSDADAAAYGGDELWAQGATVPPDPWSLD